MSETARPARRSARALAAVALSAATLFGGLLVSAPAHAAAPQEVSAQALCQYRVTANGLYVRSGPGTQYTATAWLASGTIVHGTSTLQNGFRKLSGTNRWASNQYLARTSAPCAV